MIREPRLAVATFAVLSAFLASASFVDAKKPAAAPSPSPSASPGPLPTATPEPPEVAVPRLEGKLKTNPSDQDALRDLAGYYLAANRPDAAYPLTQKLLQLGNKTAQTYFLDGVANQGLGRVNEATADFENASNREPTNSQILLTLTDLYLRQNRGADAERVAKRATTFNVTDPRVFENYGLVLAQENKMNDARAQFEAAAKLAPKDPLPFVLEARSYITEKNPAAAQQTFDRALALDAKNSDALLGKARLYAAGKDTTNAIATYEQLYNVVPNDDAKAAVYVEEYQVYRDAKNNDKALDTLKRGEAALPKSLALHVAHGDYEAGIAKDQAAAEREWKTALGPDRNNTDALTRLGELSLQQRHVDDALGYFKRLTQVAPNDPAAWSTAGTIELQTSRFRDAHDAFRRAFELARTPQFLAGVGTTDLQLKNYKECSAVFSAIDKNAAPFMKQNPQLLYAYGKCALANGEKDKARSAYTRLRPMLKPNTPVASEVNKALASLAGGPASGKPKTKSATKPKG